MTLRPVDAVEIVCDGCGFKLPHPEFDDPVFVKRDDAANWIDADDWKTEDGQHFCCGQGEPRGGQACYPPSMREDDDA